MAFEEKRKCLWHAFFSLQDPNTEKVQKSKLKVLTHNIGSVLGVENALQCLEDLEEDSLDFNEYSGLIRETLFKEQEHNNNATSSVIAADNSALEKVCWMLCGKKYLSEESCGNKLKDNDAYKLWTIFNFLTDNISGESLAIPVCIDHEEANYIFNCFELAIGQNRCLSPKDCDVPSIRFEELLKMFVSKFAYDLTEPEISLGIRTIYDEIIGEVIKKGLLHKKGQRIASWKERCCVLTPQEFKYFTGPDERDMKGSTSINKSCKLESIADKSGARYNRFLLVCQSRTYEISASDLRSKNEWMTALQKAINLSESSTRFQKEAHRKRQHVRYTRRQMKAEDGRKRQEELDFMEQQKLELEAERKARSEAEARFLEEAAQREAEQQRLRELEEIQAELEKLLEEERQAKKDEETVRAIQARILEEEFLKREELERLQIQQDELLQMERQKTEGLEDQKREQLEQLRIAQETLRQLEAERAKADAQLRESIEKLRIAEVERTKTEQRVKIREMVTPVRLAQPVLPHAEPLVTHRGPGAFVTADFVRKDSTPRREEDDDKEETLSGDHFEEN